MRQRSSTEIGERDGDRRPSKKRLTIGRSRPAVRIPELLVGVTLVIGCVVVSLMVNARGDAGSPVLVTSRPLPKGSILTSDDLRVASVSSSDDLVLLSPRLLDDVVGSRTTVDLEPGSPLLASHFDSTQPLLPGEALFGLVVTPSEAPIELTSGDRVAVVAIEQTVDLTSRAVMVTPAVEVWSISSLDEMNDERMVTLRVPLQLVESLAGRESLTLSKVVDR